MDHRRILSDLEPLVEATYQLWDEEWVGFTWRNYTFEHVQRVRALARSLGEREGADGLVLEYAALLHDITKGYDGEIIEKDGQRQLDENGLWRNRPLLPARHNEVTEIYESASLAGTLHNESGAAAADALLTRCGVEALLRGRVADVIRAHLRPAPGASLEERLLYDADTIDANIGLPAFHRNLYIVLHREELQREQADEDFAGWIDGARVQFLAYYLRERVPAWIDSRRQLFLDRLTTESAYRVAEARYDNLAGFVEALAAELDSYEEASRRGGLAVLGYLIDNRRNPRMSEQVAALLSLWGEGTGGLAGELVRAMHAQMAGRC